MSDALMPSGQPNRIVLYNAADGRVTVNVHFAQDNFCLRVPRINGGGSCFQNGNNCR
jgi:hypothetical protein